MPRLPVLFFAPVPDFKGGAERSLMDLVANPAIAPHLVVPEEGPLSEWAKQIGMPFDTLDFGAISAIRRPFTLGQGLSVMRDFWKAARGLNAIARQREAALVHSNGLKAHAIAIAARRLGGRPTIIHIRDIANTPLERKIWRGFQMLSDHTVLISRACWPGETLPGNAQVIYNAFKPPSEGAPAPTQPPFVIGFAGRIHPHKGLHVLIDALAIAHSRGGKATLLIRGAFAPETPGYEAEIRQRIREHSLETAVTFAGYVSDPALVYEGMHAVCMPSTMPEPFGRAAMEAMGRGMAVIANPCGGVPELIEHGKTGLLATTADEIASELLRLENDTEFRDTLGKRAREHCLAHFSLPRLHDEINGLYARALSGQPRTAHAGS